MNYKIKDLVADILLEEPEDKKAEDKKSEDKKSKSKEVDIEASTGSGRYSRGVSEAGALAKDSPKELMKNLGVSSASGSSDLEKITSILKQAMTGTSEMSRVYTGLSKISASGNKPEAIKVKVDIIKVRDGVKYMYHTLVGARNAGVLKINSLIQVENFQGDVIIYQGAKRSYGN